MSPPLRLLVISYAFPPFGEVGSVRIAQLCRYLGDYGVEPVVLCPQEKFYEVCDQTIGEPANVRVLRTSMIHNPLYWYGKLKRRLKSALPSTFLIPAEDAPANRRSSLRTHILALLQFPDRHWGWYLPAVHTAEEFLRNEHVDAIFSSGPPWISHVIARHLKEKFGMPWLVDFRDPWASLVPRSGPSWAHDLAQRMEASCMRLSDLVLCNTDRLRQAFQRHYANLDPTKFRTLSNGYEHLPIPHVEKNDSKRVLLHLGSLYGLRRIDTFLAALSDLVASGRLPVDSFQVIFQGDIGPSFLSEGARIVPNLLQNKSVEFRPRVSWSEALNLLWKADLLLLFQGAHELQIPAKFYEYLQTGIPIFAVTEEGALTDILQETESGIWAPSGDSRVIAQQLLVALRLPRHTPEYVSNRFSGKYHYSGLAERLSQCIKEVNHASKQPASISHSPL